MVCQLWLLRQLWSLRQLRQQQAVCQLRLVPVLQLRLAHQELQVRLVLLEQSVYLVPLVPQVL